MSLSLRAGVAVEDIIDQCKSIKPCAAYVSRTNKKHDTSRGSSCPSAIGYALEDLYEKIQERCFADFDLDKTELQSVKVTETSKETTTKTKCPECGEEVVFEGGCVTCRCCGWSRCD